LIRRACLVGLIFCLLSPSVRASTQIFRESAAPTLVIRDYPVHAVNNSGSRYHFILSVLGANQAEGFQPLLAIGARQAATGESHWLALWNLSRTSPSVWQRFRAGAGLPGAPRGSSASALSLSDRPEPCLSVGSLRAGAWTRARWKIADQAIRFSGYVNPARYFVNNYASNGADLDERGFHQTYTLLELYEATSQIDPSPAHLPVSEIMEIKYHLLVNRRLSGVFLPRESVNEVVQRFESQSRAQSGNTASYLHANANLYRLGLKEIEFGLPGRVPICRGALLSIRQSSLPSELPKWSKRNPFDLDYNPYEKPAIRELMEKYPDEEIPLAFYVLSSEYRLKPILVADFFKRRSGIGRESSRVWRNTLDQALDMTNIPLLYRALGRISGYALNKKDYTRFSRHSTAAGVEPARLFARLNWTFDADMNDLLLKALEKRRANPLADSAHREDQAAKARLDSLLAGEGRVLAGCLRRLFEDEIRATLKLGRRAVFDPDLSRFENERTYLEALRLVREFGADTNLPAQSWDRILDAWALVRSRRATGSADAKRFLDRLRRIEASAIPSVHQAAVQRILNSDLALGVSHRQPGSD